MCLSIKPRLERTGAARSGEQALPSQGEHDFEKFTRQCDPNRETWGFPENSGSGRVLERRWKSPEMRGKEILQSPIPHLTKA